ncbi:MAG: helix-turn-helix transcriptional regulator [Oryzomonas sp.]|jgi:predicted transcriptional regulator
MKYVIHAIQSPLTKKKPGLTVCDREYHITTFVSDRLELVTCRRCLKRGGWAVKVNAESKKVLSIDPEQLNLFIAARILLFRKSAKLSQNRLAEMANMRRVRVSLLERGQIKVGVAELFLFSGIFRKKITDFLPELNMRKTTKAAT